MATNFKIKANNDVVPSNDDSNRVTIQKPHSDKSTSFLLDAILLNLSRNSLIKPNANMTSSSSQIRIPNMHYL